MISGVISKVTPIITHIRGLITLLITTYEPPSICICNLQPPLQALIADILAS